jgi:hypothetical protein
MRTDIIREFLNRWGLMFLLWHALWMTGIMDRDDGSRPSEWYNYAVTFTCALIVTWLKVRERKKKHTAT